MSEIETAPAQSAQTPLVRRVSNKQLVGGVAGVAASLAILQPLTSMFLTNDRAETLRVEIGHLNKGQNDLQTLISRTSTELSNKIDNGNKAVMEAIKETEARNVRNDDRLEKRIDHTETRLDTYEASANNVGGKARRSN